MQNVQIILCDTDARMVQAWQHFCGDLDMVTIRHGSILDVICDAVISPANSFGFMDGGIDAAYVTHFGVAIQQRVQRQITQYHGGELLVGSADIVETDDPVLPYLIIAPTMRVPMILRDSVSPYLAARAVFLLLQRGTFQGGSNHGEPIANYVYNVAIPGLGTGVGQIGPNTCAYQMRQALNDTLLGKYTPPKTWAEASERHQHLYTSTPQRLQHN